MASNRTVREVIGLARRWIGDRYGARPDFVGAHLVGSLHHMPLDAPFASYQDVDLAIILDSITEQSIVDDQYEGLIIEAILAPVRRYESAGQLCADACNASILAGDHSILFDPRGRLAPLAAQVRSEFARRVWVRARRDAMQAMASRSLDMLKAATHSQQAAFALGELNMYLIAVLTTAHLAPLTHRRNLLQLKALVSSDEERAVFEELHRLMGSDTLTRADAEELLNRAVRAFDYAVSVHRTPVPYGHKLNPCVRPYLVEGTHDMLEEGGHRESFFWIALFLMVSCAAIQADGTPSAQAEFLPLAGQVLKTMGIDSAQAIRDKAGFAGRLAERIYALSDRLIQDNPVIYD